jgi:hypothetical protein
LHSRRAAHSSTEKRPDRRSPRPLRTRGSRILRRFARSADCATMPPHKPFDCETAYTQEKKRRDDGARGAAFARGLLLSACGPLRCLDIREQRIGPGQLACTDGLLRVSEHLQGRSGILPLATGLWVLRTPQSQQTALYSITSSARASSFAGTSRPSALAVLRLITSLSTALPAVRLAFRPSGFDRYRFQPVDRHRWRSSKDGGDEQILGAK